MEALDDILKKRMERYPTPKATADLGHAVGAEIARCGYQRSSVLRYQRLRADAL